MDSRAVINFAERVLSLLDQGKFTSTYKFAVLIALIDLSIEKYSESGKAPRTLSTRDLANKVIQIYWLHTNPFEDDSDSIFLLQNSGQSGAQASILNDIAQFRKKSRIGSFAPFFGARLTDPSGFEKLVDKVEWKLIQMPLPRLQRIGKQDIPFIYSINWDDSIKQGHVSRYQKGLTTDFDNIIYLKPNVGDCLIQLNTLLRPLIKQQWACQVAETNRLNEAKLQQFLFSTNRLSTTRINEQLTELQDGRCFYCHKPVGNSEKVKPEVDHFIPWSRYPNDSLANFVVAHRKCNANKKDFLAYEEHLSNWVERFKVPSQMSGLATIAQDNKWDVGDSVSQNIGRAIYLNLHGGIDLWKIDKSFTSLNKSRIQQILS